MKKMDVYAYVSIAEFTLKLIAALLLNHISGDNLILYSVLIFLIAILFGYHIKHIVVYI